jgi:hypothetical protein
MAKPSGLSALEVKAVRVCVPRGVRHPKDLPPDHAALADRALQRIVDVMEEEVHSKRAKGVLSAAIEIREEICGPKTQKFEIGGSLESILTASLVPPPSLPPAEAPQLPPMRLADELAPVDVVRKE